MRAAIVDCGTNSLRLLVAERDAAGTIRDLDRRLQIVRLGQGVDATGEFAAEALRRTFAALDDFVAVIDGLGVDRIRFVATSAARDARNRDELYAGVRARLGVDPEIITGAEEARLSFAGAIGGVPDAPAPVLVVDIGGGSTELVLGHAPAQILASCSLDIGAVRLRERILAGDPPTDRQLAEAAAYVDAQLDSSGIDIAAARTWIGVAGTMTSLAAVDLGLTVYDPERVHGHRLALPRLRELAGEFARARVDELAESPVLPRKRAEVIAGGAIIADRIAARVRAPDLLVSERDILDGLATDLLGAR